MFRNKILGKDNKVSQHLQHQEMQPSVEGSWLFSLEVCFYHKYYEILFMMCFRLNENYKTKNLKTGDIFMLFGIEWLGINESKFTLKPDITFALTWTQKKKSSTIWGETKIEEKIKTFNWISTWRIFARCNDYPVYLNYRKFFLEFPKLVKTIKFYCISGVSNHDKYVLLSMHCI